MKSRISVVVPVYADWKSLRKCIFSLQKHYSNFNWVDVYFVNDCGPEADVLEKRILRKIRNVENFIYHRNKENLGFVKNCNNAVEYVVTDKESDVLLLNSDTLVTSGFLEEMQRVLYSQDDIGIVNPRSNNATVWSVPMDSRFAFSPKKSYRLWNYTKNQIPDKYLSALCHGFCLLIRREVINKIKLFDEVYGKGYGEENDFAMRAYKKGWLCASANRAFVFHLGSKSFGDETRKELSERNTKILLKRYPDYMDKVREYVSSIKEPYSKHTNTFLLKSAHIFAKSIEYGHYNGYGVMLKKGAKSLLYRAPSPTTVNEKPRVHVWTHQVTYTGAPMVLFNLLREWKKAGLPKNIVYYFPQGAIIDDELLAEIRSEGFKFESANYMTTHFNPGDIVVLNSSAYPDWIYQKIIAQLAAGKLKSLFLYIHEDDDKMLGALNKFSSALKDLINKGLVTVYTPSSNSALNWQKFFNLKKGIYSMPGHITYSKGMFVPKAPDMFNEIDFIIAGSSEPHKGQLGVLYAFINFYNQYYKGNEAKYRDFLLTIAGLKDSGGYYSDFIINASKSLKEKVKLIYNPNLKKMHKAMAESNFTITYSIKDSFSIVTMEGMAFGHPIIRSESSGRQEQLSSGNGWGVSTSEWEKLVDTIEVVLNKDKTSNQKLAKMSTKSIEIAKKNLNTEYRLINDLKKVI